MSTTTLADHLRALSDEELGALLRARPDLGVPLPADISQLAGRVASRVSVARALDGLDRFTLEMLDALRYIRGRDGRAELEMLLTMAAEAGLESTRVRQAVHKLQELQLAYEDQDALRLVGAIDELTSAHPLGLGRPAAELTDVFITRNAPSPLVDPAQLAADAAGLRRMLLSAPPEARAVLDRLAEGPPIGQVAMKAGVETPVAWLVEHGLLVMISADLVELPREVALVLRRDTGPLGMTHPEPPELDGPTRGGADSAAAGQAMEAVRHLDALLSLIATTPPPRLKTMGLGIRELRRLAKLLGISEPAAALLLEIAEDAGLLAIDSSTPNDPRFLPTPAYDTWRAGPISGQWALVARTWLAMNRAPSLVGQRDDRDKPINALSLEVRRASAASIRRATLEVFALIPPGQATDPESVVAHLAWRFPRRYARQGSSAAGELARAVLREAAELGVTGLDAFTEAGRVLLADRPGDESDDPLGIRAEPDALVAALERLLPAPVDHVLVQADLTVVVPGPPDSTLAAELAASADAESRGGATVYRVTPTSVRRALDAGYTQADLHALFTRRSRTPVPQTLTYLIDDVARRHGGLRVGSAGAYLRGEDETLMAEVLADRRLAGLALRRLAPTVLACPHSPGRLLDALREAGYAPVAEDATGAVVVTRPTALRAPLQALRYSGPVDEIDRQRLSGARLAAAVEQLRRGDRLARAARRSPLAKPQTDADGQPVNASQAHQQALAVLRQGITERRRVWVGFVDAHGATGSRLVRPVSMGGGFLHAEDDRSQTRHTFALHRITAAALD